MTILRILVRCAMILAFCVVLLGAYTRLTNAGLGCPDWPGCYGRMVVPKQSHAAVPIESRKAWTEMIHRYAAGSLALLIIVIGLWALRLRSQGVPVTLPFILFSLMGFQAALGMWTVTLKLLPIVVMGHLLGGLLIFGCLVYFNLLLSAKPGVNRKEWRGWANAAIVIVLCQIALGGWVSSNYAGIACVGFPQCNGQWLPQLSWLHSFDLWSPLGANYQGGLLDHSSRVTIQMVHRFGALITFAYLMVFSYALLQHIKLPFFRQAVFLVLIAVTLQVALGVANVVFFLPLWVAVAHNGMAALLFAAVLRLRYNLITGVKHVRSR